MPKQPGEDILDLALTVFTDSELAELSPRQFEDFVLMLNARLREGTGQPTAFELARLKWLATARSPLQ
jgi:hypothetical protein